MNRNEERALIEQALNKENVEKEVTIAVRRILKERAEQEMYTDSELRSIVIGLTEYVSPHLQVTRHPVTSKGKISAIGLFGCGFVGALGLWAIHSDSDMARWTGGLAIAAGGLLAGKNIASASTERFKRIDVKVAQSASDIHDEIDSIYGKMRNIISRNQLEAQYASVLRWIQELWSDGDEETKKGIDSLLKKIKYELVDFDKQYSDFFDSNKATNITGPVTTCPAVRNIKTGDIVERGHVIFPV